MLKWALAHRGLMLGFSALTIISIVPLFMVVGKNFLPEDDKSQFNVLVRTPEGTSLPATAALTERIAQQIRALPGVTHTLMTSGRRLRRFRQQFIHLCEAHRSRSAHADTVAE